MTDAVYDIETYPNVFTFGVSEGRQMFVISPWRDDRDALYDYLIARSRDPSFRLVGFNNVGFDYPVVHEFMNIKVGYEMESAATLVDALYSKAMQIIEGDNRWENIIPPWEVRISQVDLYMIHHFDNMARATSLKLLEFNMRRPCIEDLPFPPGTELCEEDLPVLIDYNWEDIDATDDFLSRSKDMIEFRDQMSSTYDHDFTNYNDTKIGKQYLIMELEKQQPGCCFSRDESGRRSPNQTHYDGLLPLSSVIFPYIRFHHPEFQRILRWFNSQNENVEPHVYAEINGFKIGPFGVGGLHGSITDGTIGCTPDTAIIDIDVKSYYPNLAIKNRLFPKHLSERYCDIYEDIYEQRKSYPKNHPINKALKLALNGSFGDSGSPYSPFFDLSYLYGTTVNGQLLLCMLIEYLVPIPGLEMIQVNTDGITVKIPRNQIGRMHEVMDWWQSYTQLELEEVEYNRMWIRDVNNYIAETMSGEIKRKGAYENLPPAERNPVGWHQNLSAIVVPLAVEAHFTRGVDIRQFLEGHQDTMDFMLRTKIPRSNQLMLGDEKLQRITRYLITKEGSQLVKIAPPTVGYQVGQWKRANSLTDAHYQSVISELRDDGTELDSTGLPWDERINTKNKSKYTQRETSINTGWNATPFNRLDGPIDRSIINYDFYQQEAEKLLL